MLLKTLWHRAHTLYATIKLRIRGNYAEKIATKGRLFDENFIGGNCYVRRLKRRPHRIEQRGYFNRVDVDGHIFYWPATASINSLWAVLAEAILPDHPHHFDCGPTAVKPNDRILDIGACEGAFCLSVASKVQRVVALEPSFTMIEAMKLAAEEREISNIEYVAGLLGKEECELGFAENMNAPEASQIMARNEANEFRKCWTLDSFIAHFFPDGIDYIKCDTEGADFDILKSGENALKKYRPRIAVATYHNQHHFRMIQDYLEEIGYTVMGQGVFYSAPLHKVFPFLLKAY